VRKELAEARKMERAFKQQRIQEKQAQEIRTIVYTKHHDPKPSFDDVERRRAKIATTGVVALFNAVAKHQESLRAPIETPAAAASASSAAAVVPAAAHTDGASSSSAIRSGHKHAEPPLTSKAAFMKSLYAPATTTGSAAVPLPHPHPPPPTSSTAGTAAPPRKKWSVLDDKYLMGSKLKDWDKETVDAAASDSD